MTERDPVLTIMSLRVGRARAVRGWTMNELRGRAGLASSSSIHRMEHGKDVQLTMLAAVARAFGVTVAELLTEPQCQACLDEVPAGFICATCGTGQ